MANRMGYSKKKLPVIVWLGVILVVLIVSVVTFLAVKRATGIVKSQDDVERISAEATIKAMESGKAVLLDTRAEVIYLGQHAKGALSFPLTDVEVRMSELDPEQYYITYCT
jgi:hypothetical protein